MIFIEIQLPFLYAASDDLDDSNLHGNLHCPNLCEDEEVNYDEYIAFLDLSKFLFHPMRDHLFCYTLCFCDHQENLQIIN